MTPSSISTTQLPSNDGRVVELGCSLRNSGGVAVSIMSRASTRLSITQNSSLFARLEGGGRGGGSGRGGRRAACAYACVHDAQKISMCVFTCNDVVCVYVCLSGGGGT